jgi:alkanesulfonate monooxygenase SsuD/methylene tetrahydromethanopterin reductase-like flavin-dependent oxidoreductase (luciferase family)
MEQQLYFGVTPREWGDFFPDAYTQTKVAEENGFDSVWFEEHHGHHEYLPCPLSALAVLSQHTKMKLGTNIAILPLYHPLRLAEEVAQLDSITHGRVILGVAAGYREKDFNNFGVSLRDRAKIMDEGLILVDKLLRYENVSYDGKFFKLRDATVQPRPYAKPRPPIWVGGWKPAALRRAARLADAWFPGPTVTFSEIIELKKIYDDELRKLGKARPFLPIMRDVYVAETTEKALRESEESFIDMYQVDYSSSGHPLISGERKTFEEWAEDRFVVGNPDVAIEAVEKYWKNGFNYIVLRAALRKLTSQQVVSSIRLFGQKVIPYFKHK